MDTDFNTFWKAYAPDETRFPHRRGATFHLWCQRSEMAQQAMLAQVTAQPPPKSKNPYFFVLDFPEPEPKFLRGDEKGDLVQVRYNGLYKICTRETAQQFHLQITKNW